MDSRLVGLLACVALFVLGISGIVGWLLLWMFNSVPLTVAGAILAAGFSVALIRSYVYIEE